MTFRTHSTLRIGAFDTLFSFIIYSCYYPLSIRVKRNTQDLLHYITVYTVMQYINLNGCRLGGGGQEKEDSETTLLYRRAYLEDDVEASWMETAFRASFFADMTGSSWSLSPSGLLSSSPESNFSPPISPKYTIEK